MVKNQNLRQNHVLLRAREADRQANNVGLFSAKKLLFQARFFDEIFSGFDGNYFFFLQKNGEQIYTLEAEGP
jgi:hypothetical protein